MTKTKGIVLAMTFVGCILVTGLLEGGGAVITWQGIGIGLAAGVGYALYSIFGRYALVHYHPYTVTVFDPQKGEVTGITLTPEKTGEITWMYGA
mgnify:CR=1 FL=1